MARSIVTSRCRPAPVAAAFIAAVVARTAIEAAFAWRERVRLRHAFGGYVSPAVMAEIEWDASPVSRARAGSSSC